MMVFQISLCCLKNTKVMKKVIYYLGRRLGTWSYGDTNLKEVKMSIGQQWGGGIPDLIGGQYMYKALDDNNNFGALRVGTAF